VARAADRDERAIGVLVADDQTVVRESLVVLLDLLPDVDVVGAVLARLDLQAVFPALLARFPRLRPAVPLTHCRSARTCSPVA
jgi:hypothetical protein